MELIDSLAELSTRQLDLIGRAAPDPPRTRQLNGRLEEVRSRYQQLRDELAEIVANRQLDRIPGLTDAADKLLGETETLAQDTDAILGYVPTGPEEELRAILQMVDPLLAESQRLLAADTGGLVPIRLDLDDAMITALVQRFDLMNGAALWPTRGDGSSWPAMTSGRC